MLRCLGLPPLPLWGVNGKLKTLRKFGAALRRQELEAQIRALGIKPGEGSKKPERAAKYRGPQGELSTGVGRHGRLAKEATDAGEDIERFRVQP
jgi:DNA-binding protein H-NS